MNRQQQQAFFEANSQEYFKFRPHSEPMNPALVALIESKFPSAGLAAYISGLDALFPLDESTSLPNEQKEAK